MFFLLRMGFWLTIVLLLLPGMPDMGTAGKTDGEPKVGAFEAMSAASSAVADAGGFCARQPQACAIGANLFGVLGERAAAGAQMAISYVTEQLMDQKRKAAARAAGSPADDTLTARDLSPEWQGPVRPGAPATLDASTTGSTGRANGGTPAPHIPLPPKRPA